MPILFVPGVIASIWGGPVRLLADELGVVVDEVRERRETWVTGNPIECTMVARRARARSPGCASRSRGASAARRGS